MREKKTMKNKKKILSCISLLAFAALAAGFAGAGVRANAAETAGETQKANGFYMEAGASVRIDGKAGVRFQAYLSADKYAELIETPRQAGKDVKIYAVANRSDTGATLGATNAVRQEVSLPLPDENGGYTLQARVTYDELAADTIKKAEIGEEFPLTLMDSENNVLNTSFVYGYTTISGSVQGASGTVTATNEGGKSFAGEITDENAYTVDVLANETYNLYFDCGSGATATDGILNGIAVQTEAVTANLDKTYAKITVGKYGEMSGDTTTSGNWIRTANNEYTTYGTNHGDAFTIAQLGKSENFIVSARIQGGSGMQAGFTLLTGGTVQNLQIFRNGNDSATGARKFTMYSWGVQWIKSGLLDKSAPFDDENYTLTLIKYENKLHLYVDNTFLVTFEGTIKATNGTLDFSTLGSVTVGMSLRGKSSKTVKFSDWSYSAADSDITAYMSAHNS